MNSYYNGVRVEPTENKSISEALNDLGISKLHWGRAIDFTADFYCCPELEKYYDLWEENFDFGTDEMTSINYNVAVDANNNGFVYGWVPMKFCPFCGKRLYAKFEFKEEE